MSTFSKQILPAISVLVLFVSLIMVIVYGRTSCSSGYNPQFTGAATTSFDCLIQAPAFCSYQPAFSTDIYNNKLENSTFVTCPWRTVTAVFGYVGMTISLLYMLVVAVGSNISPKTGLLGIGGAFILLVSLVLMVVDLILGSKASSIGWTFVSQGPFIANTVLTAVALILVGYGVLTANKSRVDDLMGRPGAGGAENPAAVPVFQSS